MWQVIRRFAAASFFAPYCQRRSGNPSMDGRQLTAIGRNAGDRHPCRSKRERIPSPCLTAGTPRLSRPKSTTPTPSRLPVSIPTACRRFAWCYSDNGRGRGFSFSPTTKAASPASFSPPARRLSAFTGKAFAVRCGWSAMSARQAPSVRMVTSPRAAVAAASAPGRPSSRVRWPRARRLPAPWPKSRRASPKTCRVRRIGAAS